MRSWYIWVIDYFLCFRILSYMCVFCNIQVHSFIMHLYTTPVSLTCTPDSPLVTATELRPAAVPRSSPPPPSVEPLLDPGTQIGLPPSLAVRRRRRPLRSA